MRIFKRKALKPAARYAELDENAHPMTIRLADSRDRRPPEHKADVVAFLRSGVSMASTLGAISVNVSRDCFDPTKHVDSTIVTDGTYSWMRALAHYVDLYNVFLPPAFEGHMRARSWRSPANINKDKLYLQPLEDPSADDLAKLAREFQAAERHAEAEAAYRRVLEAEPSHRRSLDELSESLSAQHRKGELVVLLDRAIAHDPENAISWYRRGRALAEQAKTLRATRVGLDAMAHAEGAHRDLQRAIELGHPAAPHALRSLIDPED